MENSDTDHSPDPLIPSELNLDQWNPILNNFIVNAYIEDYLSEHQFEFYVHSDDPIENSSQLPGLGQGYINMTTDQLLEGTRIR